MRYVGADKHMRRERHADWEELYSHKNRPSGGPQPYQHHHMFLSYFSLVVLIRKIPNPGLALSSSSSSSPSSSSSTNSSSLMKIQCDVCEKATATVICCADEAALCAKCDVEVHAANKLASKHQRLVLESLSNKLPRCDICQDKAAFIFCVEDRALFCQDCDESIHSGNSLSANHQRFLTTGIRVALTSSAHHPCSLDPPPTNNNNPNSTLVPTKLPPSLFSPPWAVDDLLQLSDFESSDKKESLEFGELEWVADMGLFGEQFPQEALAAAEVPQLPVSQSSNYTSYRPPKSNGPYKKPRIEIPDDEDDEHFTVPDLGIF